MKIGGISCEEVGMEKEIGKSEVEIGWDEEEGNFYLEAGSREAAYSFIGLLLQSPEAVMAYVETHITQYEEVDMTKATGSATRGRPYERIELIHMLTKLINSSGITEINNRDDATALAIILVNGFQGEEELLEKRKEEHRGDGAEGLFALVCPECDSEQVERVAVLPPRLYVCEVCGCSVPVWRFLAKALDRGMETFEVVFQVPIKCPACETTQEGAECLGSPNHVEIACLCCGNVAALGDFRKDTPGYGGKK